MMLMASSSVTRTQRIAASYETAFGFLANPNNLVVWSFVDITELTKAGDGWWGVQTLAGPARLRTRCNEPSGVIDFEFDFADWKWLIPTRLWRNVSGCDYVITLLAWDDRPGGIFSEQLLLIDQKLVRLKFLLEAQEAIGPFRTNRLTDLEN
jgi:hypothetical protein